MTDMYKRRIRILGKPDNLTGFSVRILDAETGDLIPNVARATIYINPNDVNKAALVYHEVDEHGHLVVKNGTAVEYMAEAVNPEVDLVALERGHTQIGGYDITYEVCATPDKAHALLTIEDEARNAVQFYPDEALELLKWLLQERPNLEMLAKTRNASRTKRIEEGLHEQ